MAIYTLTTTAQQESLLTWIVGQYNVEHDAALTNDQFVTLRFPQMLAPFAKQFQDHLVDKIKEKFNAADTATQQQVLTLLNVK
jgi:hypothetical protein